MRTSRSAAVAMLTLLALACRDEPRASPSPPGSSTRPPATETPTPAVLSSGEATMQIAGGLEFEGTLGTLVAGTWAGPPGEMALVWADAKGGGTSLGIRGGSFAGTRSTSASLVLSVTLASPDGTLASFESLGGECDIAIDVLETGGIDGGFWCAELAGMGGQVVDLTGSFSAAG